MGTLRIQNLSGQLWMMTAISRSSPRLRAQALMATLRAITLNGLRTRTRLNGSGFRIVRRCLRCLDPVSQVYCLGQQGSIPSRYTDRNIDDTATNQYEGANGSRYGRCPTPFHGVKEEKPPIGALTAQIDRLDVGGICCTATGPIPWKGYRANNVSGAKS